MRTTACLTLMVAAALWVSVAAGSTLTRDADPVVLDGTSLGALAGVPVGEVVAFRYQIGWQQIPVQIDERKVVDFAAVYNELPVGIVTTAYADANTYTGADPDPNFDADDELVFMARDAGVRAPSGATLPAAVVAGSGLEIDIADPIDAGQGYVYLFRSDGSLPPGANQDYVTYDFVLLTGNGVYLDVYNTITGPNPENSQVTSTYYRTHFSDRWIRDELNVYAGGSSGVDMLDRHKSMFAPGNCGRTEDTFSNGEGAFFANLDGPVRAVRSYMGANSGPITQREHHFYDRRQDIATFLRVHPISGVVNLYDYSPQATGMTYFDDLNTGGVPVDGQPDIVVAGPLQWEMVTGVQGTVIISLWLTTDIVPFAYTAYYSDDDTPSVTQCTGDPFEYATSGAWVNQAIPNTDPNLGPHNTLTSGRVVYYDPPGQTVAAAVARDEQATVSLAVSASNYAPVAGDYNGNGGVDLADFSSWAACMTGPTVSFTDPSCGSFDFDLDTHVDLDDFADMQARLPGA